MSGFQKYVDLEVWKQARKLAVGVYQYTNSFPNSEQYGLTSQIRRCSVSIASNIAEGCGRQHSKETIHFLSIARGSLFELETQLFISFDLGYISKVQLDDIMLEIEISAKLINGFIRHYKSKETTNN